MHLTSKHTNLVHKLFYLSKYKIIMMMIIVISWLVILYIPFLITWLTYSFSRPCVTSVGPQKGGNRGGWKGIGGLIWRWSNIKLSITLYWLKYEWHSVLSNTYNLTFNFLLPRWLRKCLTKRLNYHIIMCLWIKAINSFSILPSNYLNLFIYI